MSRIRKSIETESVYYWLLEAGKRELISQSLLIVMGVSFCDDENEIIIVVVGYTTEYTKTTDLYTLNE